jgi:DNA transformation protein
MIIKYKGEKMMSDLTSLKNIGKEMERKLKSIGINSPDELKKIGSKDAFFRLKLRYPEICLVHLYTLQGAVDDMEYNQLPEEMKKDLKKFTDQWK